MEWKADDKVIHNSETEWKRRKLGKIENFN
jgi:hypothetical protein